MGFVKGLIISLLGLFLFFSLSLFGDMLMLKHTLLNPEFVASQVEKLDKSLLVEELLTEQIPFEEDIMADVISGTVADLEPWINDQANNIIHDGYDYLWGRSQNLDLTISLEPVKDSLRDNVEQVVSQSLPPELIGAIPSVIDLFIDGAYQEISANIPNTFEFNEELWGSEIQTRLEQTRQALGHFDLVYNLLIVFMLLLIAGILLISRPIKSGIRRVGIIFLSYGALQYIGILIITHIFGIQMVQAELPSAFQTWLPQFFNDLFTILKTFSIGVAVTGIVLIIAGIVPWGQKPKVQQQVLVSEQPFTCPRCGAQCTQDQRFCANCGGGLQLQHTCPRCGTIVSHGARFCPNCGSEFS